jgi:hypothetical protein
MGRRDQKGTFPTETNLSTNSDLSHSQSSFLSTAPPPINENVEGNRFRHPALLELAMSLSRPFTPSREDVSKQDNKSHMRDQVGTDADNGANGDSSGYTWSRAWVGSLPGLYRWDPIEIKPPPGFEWKETEVIYFDIYGTLIVRMIAHQVAHSHLR